MLAQRLIRTRDPHGGPDAVAIMHVADYARSDADLAGLMVRCAGRSLEVLIIVVVPRPPLVRPRVTIGLPGDMQTYTARVVPPFSALLLPPGATGQVVEHGAEGRDLTVRIDGEYQAVRGAIELTSTAIPWNRSYG